MPRNLLLGSDVFFADSFSFVLLSILLVILGLYWFTKKEKRLPPGPYGLPFLGYLPFLGKEAFKTLYTLSEKYGKIYSIRFGKTPVVVVTDIEDFKEVCSKTGLLDRPQGIFDTMPGAGGFTGSNGLIWVEQRRFTMKSVRNVGLGKTPWEDTITDEAHEFLKLLQKNAGKPIDIEKALTSSVARNILSLVISKPIEESSPISKLVTEFIDSGMTNVSAMLFNYHFPLFLRWLVRFISPVTKKDYENIEKFNEFLKKEINERKTSESCSDSGDFIRTTLQEMEKTEGTGEKDRALDEFNLIGNMTSLILGGSEATKTSIQWLMVAMVQNPDIQQKVYEELLSELGENKEAQWKDRMRLPLTYACMMEAQRWKTLSPINVMRQAAEDTQIAGYDIPKGTAVAGHLWAMHNDRRYWKNPEKFDPSRFLKNDGSLNTKQESYVPFSLGRRNCPGETIGQIEVLMYFSAIVKNFTIKPERPGVKFEVEGIYGQTYQPAPHKLRFVPRH